ncbi:MAG: entericidin A/B family lipoprotein [Betaproteobacteria bacterium]|nr:entericidin A/B family lipoprotein [Betaproteobacteria bacterium]
MKRYALLMFALWVVALAGCNTMEGLGKDIQKAGETLEKKAK